MKQARRFILSFLALLTCTIMYAQEEITGTVNDAMGPVIGAPDTWKMGVCLNTGAFSKDLSTHPIYAGIKTEKLNDQCFAAIAFKGPGWTEDHNCLFFDIPAKLTGLDNTTQECYDVVTNDYGIYPLGTWDSQCSWVSQLNV